MGKAYVKFMVQHPDYLKLMFLSDSVYSIKIKDNKCYGEGGSAFEIFKSNAESFFKEINLDESLYIEKVLAMWSLVHGISILLTKKSLEYDGDYMELVERIIKNGLMI